MMIFMLPLHSLLHVPWYRVPMAGLHGLIVLKIIDPPESRPVCSTTHIAHCEGSTAW